MIWRRFSAVALAGAMSVSGLAALSVSRVGAAMGDAGHQSQFVMAAIRTRLGVERLSASPLRADSVAADPTIIPTTSFSGTVIKGKNLTEVGANWVEPTLKTSTGEGAAGTAIELEHATSTEIIAVGSEEIAVGATTSYRAWYQVGPTATYLTATTTTGGSPKDTVKPGDKLSGSVTNAGGSKWKVVVVDTGHWNFSTTVTFTMTATSAGWGTALRFVTSNGTLQSVPLADYVATKFSHLKTAASGGASTTPSATSAYPLYMFDKTSNVRSVASRIVAATAGSFTDHFVSVPARIYGATPDATAMDEFEHQFPTGQCPGTTGSRSVILATDKTYADALSSAYLASDLGTGTLLTPPSSLSSTVLAALKQEGITTVDVVGGPLAVSNTEVTQLQQTPAYSCGGTSQLGTDLTVQRISGATAYDTSLQIATTPKKTNVGKVDLAGAYDFTNSGGGIGLYNVTKGSASKTAPGATPVPTAVVATGHTFQDAMAASTLAYADHLPILLTTSSKLSPQASTAITKLGIKQAIVMGGPLAVSNSVVAALESEHVSVLRVAGADYTETAVELAACELGSATKHVGLNWAGTGGAMVARGNGFTDGLAGAVVAANGPKSSSPVPLLLTEDPTTPGTYLSVFLQVAGATGISGKKFTHFTILGGPLAVSLRAADLMAVALAF